jgi:hypothetical protein
VFFSTRPLIGVSRINANTLEHEPQNSATKQIIQKMYISNIFIIMICLWSELIVFHPDLIGTKLIQRHYCTECKQRPIHTLSTSDSSKEITALLKWAFNLSLSILACCRIDRKIGMAFCSLIDSAIAVSDNSNVLCAILSKPLELLVWMPILSP